MSDNKRKYYQWNQEDLERALSAYDKKEMSLNKIAETYSVSKPTIIRHAKKRNKIAIDAAIQKGRPTVFSPEHEDILVKHILELEKYMFGLTISNVRSLAFEIAEKRNIPHNFNKEKRMAGKGWFYKFMKRHPELSVRQPENTSLNIVKGFNRENVNNFYDLLEKLIDENGLTPTNIFNVDESGFSTVQKKAQRVVALKGKKQVGAITSGERGVNTTAVCCTSVAGQFIPPMLIFKRMRQNPELADGGPLGSVVTVSETGYINSTLFVEWLKHFITVVKPTSENKVLILLDGHTTHSKNLEALNLAKASGILMLQLPGHTTHRLQPLDVSFFKPLSTYYIQATEKWLRTNPGYQVTQYKVAKLFAEAYERAAMISNAVNGFKATGVWPVNRHVFPEHWFDAADNLNADPLNSSNESTLALQKADLNNETNNKENDKDTERKKISKKNDQEKGQERDKNEKEGKQHDFPKTFQSSSLSTMTDVQPSTSRMTLQLDAKAINKSLKTLSPMPKNTLKKKNTIQKAVEITSSPYKKKLEETVTRQKKVKGVLGKGKENRPKKVTGVAGKRKKTGYATYGKGKMQPYSQGKVQTKRIVKTSNKRKRASSTSSDDSTDVVLELDDESDDDMENVCAICNGDYYDKKGPNVDWIQCVRCHRWVHETCTSNPDICDNCFK